MPSRFGLVKASFSHTVAHFEALLPPDFHEILKANSSNLEGKFAFKICSNLEGKIGNLEGKFAFKI